MIVMGVTGWFGFDEGNPITISNCGNSYGNIFIHYQNLMLRASFVLGLSACVCLSLVLIMMIIWISKVCKDMPPS